MVQWLRLCIPNSGHLDLVSCQGTKLHILQLRSLHVALKASEQQKKILKKIIFQYAPLVVETVFFYIPAMPYHNIKQLIRIA